MEFHAHHRRRSRDCQSERFSSRFGAAPHQLFRPPADFRVARSQPLFLHSFRIQLFYARHQTSSPTNPRRYGERKSNDRPHLAHHADMGPHHRWNTGRDGRLPTCLAKSNEAAEARQDSPRESAKKIGHACDSVAKESTPCRTFITAPFTAASAEKPFPSRCACPSPQSARKR